MSGVVLNGEYFDTDGDVKETLTNHAVTKAKAYHGTRGGIGRRSDAEAGAGAEQFYFSDGLNTCNQRTVMLGPAVTTAGTFGKACMGIIDVDFTGSGTMKTYAYGDNLIAEWNAAGPSWTSKETGLDDPIDAIVVRDATDTYLVVSSATTAKYTVDGTTWNTLTGCKGYLAAFDNRLMGFYDQILNYSPEGNIDGSWATKTLDTEYVGVPYKLFSGKQLKTDNPTLRVAGTHGGFNIDFWYPKIYKEEVSWTPHANAGHSGIYWGGSVYYASGAGIKKLAGVVTDWGPNSDDGLPSGYQGYVTDIKAGAAGAWLYFAVNGGSTDKSSIFKRHSTMGGVHQIYSTSAINNPIRCINVSPSSTYTRGRLWWGEGTGIKYCDNVDFTTDPTLVTGSTFTTTSGKLILPTFRALPGVNKVALAVEAVTYGCDADDYITLYHDIDETGSWTTLGTYKTSSLPTALSFGSGLGTAFKTITLAYDLRTGTSTKTPELESLSLVWYPAENRLRAWEFNIVVKGQVAGDATITKLDTILDTATLVPFYPSGRVVGTSLKVDLDNYNRNIVWDAHTGQGIIHCLVKEMHR